MSRSWIGSLTVKKSKKQKKKKKKRIHLGRQNVRRVWRGKGTRKAVEIGCGTGWGNWKIKRGWKPEKPMLSS